MTEQVTKSSPLVAALLESVESRSNGAPDVSALVALARQQDAKLMAIRRLVEASEEDRRIRQDGQPFAQFADSVIGTEELRAVLNQTSEI